MLCSMHLIGCQIVGVCSLLWWWLESTTVFLDAVTQSTGAMPLTEPSGRGAAILLFTSEVQMSKFDSAADIIEAIIALADELGWDVAIKDEDCIDMLILGRKEALTELELHYDIAFDTVTTDGSNDGYEH